MRRSVSLLTCTYLMITLMISTALLLVWRWHEIVEASATAQQPDPVKYFLVGCAKVNDAELPYMVEWLEYHRLQGFDKFVIYVDDSPLEPDPTATTTQFKLLQEYYKDVLLMEDFLEIKSTSSLLFDATATALLKSTIKTSSFHRVHQQTLIQHCWRNFIGQTEWFMHFDVDEFVSTPNPKVTVRDWLEALYTRRDAYGNYYALGSFSGVYLRSTPHGLASTDKVFAQAFEIKRNHISGQLRLIVGTTNFKFRGHDEYADMDFVGLRDALQMNQTLNAVDAFKRIYENYTEHATSAKPNLVLATLSPRSTLMRDPRMLEFSVEEAVSYLLQQSKLAYPECIPFYNTLSKCCLDDIEYIVKSHWKEDPAKHHIPAIGVRGGGLGNPKVLGMVKKSIREKIAPEFTNTTCPLPSQISGAKVTAMGKSILWTGTRYALPWGSTASVPPAEFQESARVLKVRRRGRMNPTLGGQVPMCYVAWVHGCAHPTRLPQVMLPREELEIRHFVMRTLEERTIGDAAWRKKHNSWGTMLEGPHGGGLMLSLTATPVAPPGDPARLQIAIENRFRTHLIGREFDLQWPRDVLTRRWRGLCQSQCSGEGNPRVAGSVCTTSREPRRRSMSLPLTGINYQRVFFDDDWSDAVDWPGQLVACKAPNTTLCCHR